MFMRKILETDNCQRVPKMATFFMPWPCDLYITIQGKVKRVKHRMVIRLRSSKQISQELRFLFFINVKKYKIEG